MYYLATKSTAILLAFLMAASPVFPAISPTSPLVQDIKTLVRLLPTTYNLLTSQTRLADFSTLGGGGKIASLGTWGDIKNTVWNITSKYTKGEQLVDTTGPSAFAEELDALIPSSDSTEAQLLVKVTEAEGEGDFEPGDIVHAFNRKRILTVEAQTITNPRNFGFNESGLREPGTLLETYLQHSREYKFERISETEVTRTTLADGTTSVIGPEPNEDGEHMDVPLYLTRRLNHESHLIFGTPGTEYWYGGSENISEEGLAAVWDAIEEKTDHHRDQVTSYPMDASGQSDYRLIPVSDFSDERAGELTANEGTGENPDNQGRKYQINLENLRNLQDDVLGDVSSVIESSNENAKQQDEDLDSNNNNGESSGNQVEENALKEAQQPSQEQGPQESILPPDKGDAGGSIENETPPILPSPRPRARGRAVSGESAAQQEPSPSAEPTASTTPTPEPTPSGLSFVSKLRNFLFNTPTASAAGTVTTSIGSNDRNTNISAVSGTGPWTVTITDGSVARVGDALWDEHATPRKYLITAISSNDLTVRDSEAVGGAPDNSGTSTAAVKRYYSTMTLWEADLDDTGLYASGDAAVGEAYNDAAFDEAVTINGGGTVGLASRTLTVPESERHDGTAGTGARIVLSTARTPVIATSLAGTYVQWLEIDAAGFSSRNFISHGGDVDGVIFSNLIAHDSNTTNNPVEAFSFGGGAGSVGAGIVNSILYDVQQSENSATRNCVGINLAGTAGDVIFGHNNTVYKVEKNLGSAAAAGIKVANAAGYHAKNNIAVATGGSTSGTIEDFDYAGTTIDDSNNLSSDATADDGGGSGHVIDAVTADQFVSIVDGSEDLHLKTGADAIDAGADLGTTPTGVNRDIDNRDRDAQGDTWDMGADEIVFDSIAGTVYSNEGSTALGSVTVRVAVNGTDHTTTADTNGSGAYTISDLSLASGDVVTVYLEDESQDAVTVTVSDGDSLSGVNLYQDRLITRHDNAGSLTNANLATAVVSSEDDISNIYTESSGTVTVADGKELFVWTGDTYAPGGAVVVDDIDINGTFTMAANAVTVSGTWDATGGTFTSSGTVTFDSTSTETITSNGNSFSTAVFSGSGGVWNLGDAADFDAALTITTGTLDISGFGLTTTGATFTNDATLRLQGGETLTGFTNDASSGTVEYDGSGTYSSGLAAGDAYFHLTFSGAGAWTLDAALDIDGNLAISGGTLDVSATDYAIALAGNWANSGGTFVEQEGTVTFNGSGAQTLTGETFYNLTINNTAGSPDDSTDVDSSAAITVANTLTVTDGQFQPTTASDFNDVSISATGILKPDSGAAITVSGNWANAGTFTANAGTVTFDATDTGNTINPGSSSFTTMVFNGSGGEWDITTNALDVDTALTITAGTLDINGQNLTMTGATFTNDDTFRLQGAETLTNFTNDTNSGTVIYDGSGTYATGLVGGDAYYALTFNGSGSWTLDAALDVNNNLTITTGTLVDGGNGITVGGNWSNAGIYTGTGTVTFDASSGTQTLTSGGTGTGSDFQNITKGGGGGTLQFVTNAVDIDGTLTIDASTTVDLNGQNITAATLVNNGTLRLEGGETVTITTKDTDSGTVTYDGNGSYTTALAYGNTYYILTFDGSGGVWEPNGAVTTNNNLNITNGTFDIDGQDLTVTGTFSNDATLRLLGTETLSLTHDTNSGTVSYDNTATLTNFPTNLDDQYYSVSFTGSGLVQLAANLDANGNLTIGSGANLDLNGFDLTIGGNFTNTGTLTNHSGQTITLDGTTQTFNPSNFTLSSILAITGSSGVVSLGSNFTSDNLITIAAGRALSMLSFILTLTGNITNSGTITEGGVGYIAKDSTAFFIADSNFDEDPGISLDVDNLYLTIDDEDSNKDGTSPDTISNAVVVTCPTDSETVSLTETGNATEVFRLASGLPVTTYDGSATNDDGTLECNDDATITATFTDPQDSDDTQQDTATATTVISPSAPSLLAGSADSSTAITWTWTDNSNNETGFKLYNASNNALIATIATSGATSYQETGLTASTSYSRYVRAYNSAGQSSASNTASETTDSGITTPTAPSGFGGTAASSTSITWTWTDNSSNETGFKLYNGADNSLVATIATANATSYTETGLTADTTYQRYLKAYNGSGESSATGTASVTTNAESEAPEPFSLISPANGAAVNTTTPTFSFYKARDDDDGIDSITLTVDSSPYTIPGSAEEAGGTTYTTSAITAQYFNENDGNPDNDTITITLLSNVALGNGGHTWYVVATDNAGNSRQSSTYSLTVDTQNPAFSALTDISTGSTSPTINISVTDNHRLDELVVTLEKATVVLGVAISYRALETRTYTLSDVRQTVQYTPRDTLEPGATYRIRATVSDAAGNSAEGTIALRIIAPEEAARQAANVVVQELDADEATTEEIVDKIRELLPDSPLALQDLEQFAALRRERQAENLAQFFDTIAEQIAALALSLDGQAREYLFALLNFAGDARDAMASALQYLADQTVRIATLVAGDARHLAETWWSAIVRIATQLRLATLAWLDATYHAIASSRFITAVNTLAENTIGISYNRNLLVERRLGRPRAISTAITNTLNRLVQLRHGTAEQTRSTLSRAQETRIRQGLKNRQYINTAISGWWQPVQQFSAHVALLVRYNLEVIFDKEPTRIMNVRVANLTPTSAVVEWDTNHLTRRGKVNWGTAANQPYTGEAFVDTALSTSHRAEISGLAPATTYYFEVMNQNGDYVFDAYYTLTTPAEGEIDYPLVPQDVLIKPQASSTNGQIPNEDVLIYAKPEPDAEVITTVHVGDRLRALTIQDGWVSILLPSGQEGWVQRDAVEFVPQEQPSASAQQ